MPLEVIGIKNTNEGIMVRIDWQVRPESREKPRSSRIPIEQIRNEFPELLLNFFE